MVGVPVGAGDNVDRVTRSVSDGKPVDWDRVEIDPVLDSDTVDALRKVARIAEFNRALQRTATQSDPASMPQGALSPPLVRWHNLTILEPLGAGARGEVWRAWDATLQRQVALKFLQPDLAGQNETAAADLLNEARALARVRHPGIVTVHGIGEDQGRVGIWMECVPGVTLSKEIERAGTLPPRQVARIGLQLCSALEALDAAGLVHRDIKPANILLEGTTRAVLTDFGLGWRPALDEDTTPKSSGTPLFMAPEILDGGKPTHRSDLYALGVTMWWALAGEAPFAARTLGELRKESPRGPARSLSAIRPDAPKELVEAILWAMKPTPADRPRTAAELAAKFRGSASDAPSGISIAVLPFVNRGAGDEDEYFSDGLADELIGMLGKIRGVRVAARTSAYSFRGRQVTTPEIGSALNVETILEGSIRRAGDRIRISVQLVKVSDGLHLWSETYDRTLDDIFAVQDDIARSVVSELRATLLGREPDPSERQSVTAEVAKAARGRSADPTAHRLALLGRHFINRLTRDDLTRAIDYLKQALDLDPQFASAWADLASAYTRAATWGLIPRSQAIRQARDAVERALAIEPDLPEAFVRLTIIYLFHEWDWKGAEAACRRALELAPGDAATLNAAGVLSMVLGRPEESIEYHRRAAEQDPLSASPHANLGLSLVRAHRFDEAETAFRRTLELAPQRLLARSFLALALVHQGRGEEALAELAREPDEGERLYALAIVQHMLGNAAESEEALQQLIRAHGEHYAVQVAEVYAVRGDADSMFEWLENGREQRDLGVPEIRGSLAFLPYQGDPRWRALMVRLGFEVDAA